ncbi:hypothetical protein N865_16580 [Intrasporangium oryzae NRRL B-24470]|uniref:VanZ-like domain-containing protein n=1 Tax=Intrasporangium oryzae NRRL B-24470 TaxID=1386089 RepID=W9G281_9MICO|nr:VanZ family protein [Intrasporangium oryzae]EWT00221.1 hypothetical protein N865_16580 [Intrasporangium oryzae NRRL B-24470]
MQTLQTSEPATTRPRLIIAAALAVVVQLLVLYWPIVTVEGPVSWTDKVVHVLVFAIPTYAVGRAVGSIAGVAIVFLVHAPVSELVQHFFLPGRTGDVGDAVVDMLGVLLGVAALMVRARRDR